MKRKEGNNYSTAQMFSKRSCTVFITALCIFLPRCLKIICMLVQTQHPAVWKRDHNSVSVKSAGRHRSSYKSAAYKYNRVKREESCSCSEPEPQQPGHQAAPCFHVSANKMKCSNVHRGPASTTTVNMQPARPAWAGTDVIEGFKNQLVKTWLTAGRIKQQF